MANYNFPNIPPKGSKLYVNDTITIKYTGDWQGSAFTWIPYKKVKIECWGAAGSNSGGYAWGIFNFATQQPTDSLFYIVGQAGFWTGKLRNYNLTYGGGGEGDNSTCGGGATDVRTFLNPNSLGNVIISRMQHKNIDKGTMEITSLSSRLIVAGGGGGRDTRGGTTGPGSTGGGFQNWPRVGRAGGNGGQTYGGGVGSSLETDGYDAVFGAGASGYSASGGGGGGLYGGGRGDGGGGGSAYVSGISPCVFQTSSGIKAESGGSSNGGHSGNGLIKITILEEITIGDPNPGAPGTPNPPINPGGPSGLKDSDIIRLSYIKDSTNKQSYAVALKNTISPSIIFGSYQDGPRDAAIKKSTGFTYRICSNKKDYVNPNKNIDTVINGTPPTTTINPATNSANATYTNGKFFMGRSGGGDGGHAYGILGATKIKDFSSLNVAYTVKIDAKIRYYWNGGGGFGLSESSAWYAGQYNNINNPNYGAQRGTIVDPSNSGSGIFLILTDSQGVSETSVGLKVSRTAHYGLGADGFIKTKMKQFCSCDVLTEINSCVGLLGTTNQNTGSISPVVDGINKVKHFSQDPVDWGRIFVIDCEVPIYPKDYDKYLVLGVTGQHWGNSGGSNEFHPIGSMPYARSNGNYALWIQIDSFNITYQAGWSNKGTQIMNDAGVTTAGTTPYIREISSGSNALFAKNGSLNTAYRILTIGDS